MTDTTDLQVHRLTRELNAARTVGDQLYDQGYAEGLRHSELEIPDALRASLRYGSAQEHTHIPLADGLLLTVVLARPGHGADERCEAETWEALERIRADVMPETRAGIKYVQRRELPGAIAAAVWRWPEHAAVVTSTTSRRPCLRGALRSHRSGWLLLPLVGWAIARRIGRGLVQATAMTSTVTIGMTSVVAVTVIAAAPPAAPVVQERGHAVSGQQARPSPMAYGPDAPGAPSKAPRPVPTPAWTPIVAEPQRTMPPDPGPTEVSAPAAEQPVAPDESAADAAPTPAPAPSPSASPAQSEIMEQPADGEPTPLAVSRADGADGGAPSSSPTADASQSLVTDSGSSS